jgi:trehalose/maltose hydrolase-like predicted phosphorylase
MQQFSIHDYPPDSAPAYLANGLIGLRLGGIPLPGGTALVNGFFGLSPEKSTEEYAPAPYPVGADLQVDGSWLSQRPDRAVFGSQTYDFSCGELTSSFDFHVGERTARVSVVTLCSRTHPTLSLQEVTVTVDGPCRLVLQGHLDPRGLEGDLVFRSMPGRGCDGILLWGSRGGLGTLGAAYWSECSVGKAPRRRNDFGYESDLQLTNYTLEAQPGEQYTLRQISSLVPGTMHSEPHWQASRMVGAGVWFGFDELRAANRAAWADVWRGRPLIHTAETSWQEVADAAYFYLHSSVSASSPCSVAPFGLGRRKEYSGHVFWDTETFIFPPVLLTAPEAARAMLDYRSDRLASARDNARLNGFRGLQFPWQSGVSGSEVTPFYSGAAGGSTEQHITLDVAFAFAQYVHATGDELFLKQQAWPVLEGVAEWIVSRVTRTARGYEIRHITGPDEGLDNIHNNAYTNMAAIVVLREALGCARRLGFTPPACWEAIAREIFLPVDSATQVILKHDAYAYAGGMCVPETMGGYFPFTYSHSPAVDQATARYHLDLAHTYLGMPMFSSLFGVWAARMGERALARQFFAAGVRSHLVEPFRQFNERSVRIAGPYGDATTTVFLTNPAGFLLALVLGLPGLQLDSGDPQGWAKFPIVMPAGWEGIEVERLWVRGQPMRMQAMQGEARAHLTPAQG